MKKNKLKFIILALVMLISVIGISYAFFVYYKVGDNSSKLIFGDIYLKMNEGTDTITLLNIFPETAEKARSRTDNQITFTVSGVNTTTNKDIWYEIMLNEGNEVEGRTRFNPEDLVFDLIEVATDGTETYVVDAQSYDDINAKRIWVETVDRNTTTEVNKTYKLRMWLSENVFISDTNPNATYDVETFESSYASVKVSVYGDFVEKYLLNGYIIYDMSNLGLTNLTSTPIYAGQTVTVTTEIPVIEGYSFMGWSTTLNGEVVYQAGDEVNNSDIINNNLTLYPVVEKKIIKNYLKRVGSADDYQFWSSNINDNYYLYYSNSINFISLTESEISSRCSSASYCEDVSNDGNDSVKAWFEENDDGYYDMYVASSGVIVFPSDCSYMFYGADYVYQINFENVDTSNATTMEGMFYECDYLGYSYYVPDYVLDLSTFDTSNVTNMSAMFDGCSSLESINLSSFKTGNLSDVGYMFRSCSSLKELDLSHFDTSKITSIGYMFHSCSGLELLDLSSFTLNKMSGARRFYNASDTATVYVGSTTDQTWLLALSDTQRPSAWSTSNVLVKESAA